MKFLVWTEVKGASWKQDLGPELTNECGKIPGNKCKWYTDMNIGNLSSTLVGHLIKAHF